MAESSSSTSSCQVCSQPSFKYRCAQCRTRSCSLACFKDHQSQCAAVALAKPDDESRGVIATAAPEHSGDDTSTSDAAKRDEPPLLQPEHIHDLFGQYPGLKARLNSIYQSTRQQQQQHHHHHQRAPASVGAGRRRQVHSSQSEATSPEEAALARGLASLQQALHDDDDAGGKQGVGAFAAYVKTLASA